MSIRVTFRFLKFLEYGLYIKHVQNVEDGFVTPDQGTEKCLSNQIERIEAKHQALILGNFKRLYTFEFLLLVLASIWVLLERKRKGQHTKTYPVNERKGLLL